MLQPTYNPKDPQSGPTVVTHDLDKLGIGQHWTRVGGQAGLPIFSRQIPAGHGWCRALYVAEAHWPDGAELCVEVEWHPDQKIREEGSKAENEDHWRTRVSAVAEALESVGYVAQMPGPGPLPCAIRGLPFSSTVFGMGCSRPLAQKTVGTIWKNDIRSALTCPIEAPKLSFGTCCGKRVL